jgi:uncharacterized protein DUF4268
MYSKQQASLIRKNFWTSFGQYMKPLVSVSGEPVNWLNYKTGIKHIFFRMDVNNKQASIAIELTQPDPLLLEQLYDQLQQVRSILEQTTGEQWQWQPAVTDEDGKIFGRVRTILQGVNVFNSDDWPAIISFLKPRIIALDEFWNIVKDNFS